MARPKKRITPIKETSNSSFLEALKFLSLVTKSVGAPFETHIKLENNTATAFNGVIAAGIKIEEDIYACPHNEMIINALSKCGEHLSITQLDNNRLSIKSDKFKAIVPCIDQSLLAQSTPDQNIATINDEFKTALEAVEVLTNPNALQIYGASILLNGQSCIASEAGKMVWEYWHGIDLPSKLAIPKVLAQILSKINKKLIGFGFSDKSATFWFEDKSWIRTQLFKQEWPNVDQPLNIKGNLWPIPSDFYKAIEAVAPFSEDGYLHFNSGVLRSHASDGVGASYEVYGLPAGPVYSARQLTLLKPHASVIDFMAPGTNGPCLVFQGSRIRGVIAGRIN